MPSVSVILPTFNPDLDKLERMIKSVLAQEYRDFELIIVDDGSKDALRKKIDRLQDLDTRIRIVRQENSGVSRARNHGIAESRGDYLAFVDDDDIISPYFLKEAMEIMERENCDFVLGGVVRQRSEEYDFQTMSTPSPEVLCGREAKDFAFEMLSSARHISNRGYINRGPVAKLLRKSIPDIVFPDELRCGEDQVWNIKVLSQCEKIAIVDANWYLYILYPGSASRRCTPDSIDQAESVIEKAGQYLDFSGKTEIYGDFVYYMFKDASIRWFNHKDCPLSEAKKIALLRSLSRRKPWSILCSREYKNAAGFSRWALCTLYGMGLTSLYWKLSKRI